MHIMWIFLAKPITGKLLLSGDSFPFGASPESNNEKPYEEALESTLGSSSSTRILLHFSKATGFTHGIGGTSIQCTRLGTDVAAAVATAAAGSGTVESSLIHALHNSLWRSEYLLLQAWLHTGKSSSVPLLPTLNEF
jgi:hypothetical protein